MINLTNDEVLLIIDEMKIYLENLHYGDVCEEVWNCPSNHFDCNSDIEDVFMVQSIINKLLDNIRKEINNGRLR